MTWGPAPAPDIDWAESGEPFSTRFNDVYYSSEDGLAESQHVFLAGNGLPERWADFDAGTFCIVETGFGTGLNFLLTWQSWREQAQPRPRLHYVSIEKFPLSAQQVARSLASWESLAPLANALVTAWPGRLPGQHRLLFDDGQITLDLWWEDAGLALPDMALRGPSVDAWYLDGFAPSRNEAMWQSELYQAMAALSRPNATFSTFTAAGDVRRGLTDAGFQVAKAPGFGRKRESLRGKAPTAGTPLPSLDTPWELPERPSTQVRNAIVIGAGLAGCTLAAALAQRGLRVTVLDKGPVAGEASGNEQGVLYTRLSRRHSALTDFALQSFSYSANLYRQMLIAGALQPGLDGDLCGSFHQHKDAQDTALLKELLIGLEDLAKVCSAQEAAAYLGEQPALGGYWFPKSGWLRPPAVCSAMLNSPLIELHQDCGELELLRQDGQWQARDIDGCTLASADTAIICTGVSSRQFPETDWLPVQSIRGQTSYLPATDATAALQSAFCHTGYISPATEGRHCIGASFKLHDDSAQLRVTEHRENLDKLAAALPQWSAELKQLDPEALEGRVGFRCASPDYLPIAGPVPDRKAFLQTYGALRKNARQTIATRGHYVPDLYISTAHGSRGLSSAPLCAQLLASQICQEALPLSRELIRALSPARFLMRDLARNRI